MNTHRPEKRNWLLLGLVLLRLLLPSARAAALTPGLQLQFRTAPHRSHNTPAPATTPSTAPIEPVETLIVSNLTWFAAPGSPVSPLLAPGPFEAEWTGAISVELRTEVRFQVELTGAAFELRINGTNVLTEPASNGPAGRAWSAPVRLRKGLNPLSARLTGDSSATATTATGIGVRLFWKGRGIPEGPLPPGWLSVPGTTNTETASPAPSTPVSTTVDSPDSGILRGRDLFARARCGKCHPPDLLRPMPELAFDAPSLAGIGSRRQAAWLERWILDPHAQRPQASMPAVFRGPAALEETRAVVAWLGSLQTNMTTAAAGNSGVGKALFQALLCDSCHSLASDPEDPTRLSLRSVAGKFPGTALVEYLRDPQAHYASNPMPRFGLTPAEAADLAAFLWEENPVSPASPASPTAAPNQAEPALLARGRELVESRGCLNCHPGPAGTVNRFRARSLAELPSASWERGCLDPDSRGTAPRYDFLVEERRDLRAFAATDQLSLGRTVPREAAERWTRALRCAACHGRGDGLPTLAWSGDKLRPEWVHQLLRGEVTYRPRPWLRARMPAFPAYASVLAEGLAAQHGRPSVSPEQPPWDAAAAEVGRQLTSASKGFSCVSCHAIGAFGASAVFEAPGVNFVHVAERLLPDYFARWVRNPQWLEPTTKMPLYFDEDGNSALADVYGGDGPKTIHALWSYLRQGPRLVPPAP